MTYMLKRAACDTPWIFSMPIEDKARLAVVETTSQGGLLHYATQLADGLAQLGNDVDLIVPAHNELAGRKGPANRRAILAAPTPPQDGRLAEYRPIRRAQVAARLLRAWGRVNWEVRRGAYDAVILTCDVDLWLMAMAILPLTIRRRGMRVSYVCHSVRPLNRWSGDEMFLDSPLLNRLLSALYSRFDMLFVHGEHSRSEFQATWPSARLVVIPHGDERIFSGAPPSPALEERLLFFGDWRKVKGLGVLMEAFEKVAQRRPAARLTIAGTPCPVDLDPDLVRHWAAHQEGRVRVLDRYVPVEEVPELFGSARAVVTPYLVGYQSGVVHLAMTMGRAVVASEVGDLTSVVLDGQTGLTVPAGDASALAGALERILGEDGLAERLGREGRRRLLEHASWEVVAERVQIALANPAGQPEKTSVAA
jgi:glycosyltransferase involved in cell wall biosynthesis